MSPFTLFREVDISSFFHFVNHLLDKTAYFLNIVSLWDRIFPEYRGYGMIVGNFKKEEHYDEFVWTGFFETAGFFY